LAASITNSSGVPLQAGCVLFFTVHLLSDPVHERTHTHTHIHTPCSISLKGQLLTLTGQAASQTHTTSVLTDYRL